MGLIIDISPLVGVELRRDSFRLCVDYDDSYPTEIHEYRYEEAGALLAALTAVTKHNRYLDYMGGVLNQGAQQSNTIKETDVKTDHGLGPL